LLPPSASVTRFPDRHHLIEALFEEQLAALVALAEQALLVPEGWDGLVWFLDRALSLQIADRGLAEILRGQGDAGGRVEAARDRIPPSPGPSSGVPARRGGCARTSTRPTWPSCS
jgi:hypothetical protein